MLHEIGQIHNAPYNNIEAPLPWYKPFHDFRVE
jgi:hypothetical protein